MIVLDRLRSKPRLARFLRRVLLVVTTAIAASLLFFSLASLDNKYQAPGNQAINGLLYVSEQDWDTTPIRYLCDGWALYLDKLLTPAELDEARRSGEVRYVSIGQYSDFSVNNPTRDGHGSASYEMTLMLPDSPHLYAIEIPEVYSAYRFYVNENMVLQLGNPDRENYQDATRSSLVTFWASGETTLLLSASNFTYAYSGMVYPPAFGEPSEISAISSLRLAVASALCALIVFFAFVFLLFAAAFKPNRSASFLLAAICLCGVPFMFYAPLHDGLVLPVQPWHTVEITCTYLTLSLVVALHNRICGIGRRVSLISVGLAAGFCLLIMSSSALSAYLEPANLLVFSTLINAFKVLVACYLLVTAFVSQDETARMPSVLVADVVFAVAIVWDRLVFSYEPIVGGWFIEWGVVVLALITGMLLVSQMAKGYLKNIAYEEERRFVDRQLTVQAEYLRRIEKRDRVERQLRHDFRQHLRTMTVLARENNMEELCRYADSVSDFHAQEEMPSLTSNVELDALLHHYRLRAIDQGVEFRTQLMLPHDLGVAPLDLAIVLGNVLENAVDAAVVEQESANEVSQGEKAEAPFVFVGGHVKHGQLVFVVENSYVSKVKESDAGFLSTKHEGLGLGISSAREVTRRLGGLFSVVYNQTLFRVQVSIPVAKEC